MRLLKFLVALLVLAFVGLALYAYLGDMDARPVEIRQPVPLDLGQPSAEPGAGAAPAVAPSETDAADGDSPEEPDADGLD